MNASRGVLYIATCATPAAARIGHLVAHAQGDGWTTCLSATPNALSFIDVPALERQTGFPVRSNYRRPEEDSPFPEADAVIVAGASFNTVNKWALGIADTLVLSTAIEAVGMALPVVLLPFCNAALATHMAWEESVRRLRAMGVTVLVSPETYQPHDPSTTDEVLSRYPWTAALAAVEERVPH